MDFPPTTPQVFLINLRRRSDRRERMLNTLHVLGVDATVTEAVDGKYDATIQSNLNVSLQTCS